LATPNHPPGSESLADRDAMVPA